MTITVIDTRKSQILEAVISEYEKTAEPVGSKIIAAKYVHSSSPATIRTEMLEMEAMGFLTQPHISAGRMPTDKGWRYFLDMLMENENLSAVESKILEEEAEKMAREDFDNVTRRTSKMLALLSHNLSICTILDPKDFYSFGVSEILREPEFSDASLTISVAELIDNFEENIDKIYNGIDNETVTVKVGKENPFDISDVSTIFSGFSLRDGRKGFFCLIGPKRMNYPKNISLAERVREVLVK